MVWRVCALSVALFVVGAQADGTLKKKHHHKHHHHNKDTAAATKDEPANPPAKEEQILGKMKTLEKELAKKEEAVKGVVTKGRIEVNGPLPADFATKFSTATGKA